MHKTIIITGASKGLGLSLLEKLSKQYNIATISRTSKNLEAETLLQFAGDITNYWDLKDFVEKTIIKFGQIDVLINNAGIVQFKPFLEYTEFDLETMFAVNIKGAFEISKLIITQMLTQTTGGHIINIGSTRAITGAPNKSIYSMSKFALRSMTQCINVEFKDRNIRSTIICPGQLETIKNQVVDGIDFLIKNDIRIIPEIIIGGQL
jgi:short-subunit dehydrogenase